MLTDSSISCGVLQLSRFDEYHDPADLLSHSVYEYYDHDIPEVRFIIFSDINTKGHGGSGVAEYIKTNGLGEIWQSNTRINPNTGNRICVWVWEVDSKKFSKWYKANKPKDEDECIY